MGISETKKQIVIDNYFKNTCDVNTSIKEAFTKGFEVGLTKAVFPKDQYKTDLKIILNRLKVRMKDRDEDNGGEPLNAVDRGYHLAYEHLCEEIDNLLRENEDEIHNS